MEGDLFSESELDQDLLELQKDRKIKEVKVLKETEERKEFTKKLFIVDGYSLIYRSYYAFITRPLTDKEGKNVSSYFGFFNTLFYLFRNYQFDYFVVAMDSHSPTFRSVMYPEYKANRAAAPEDLHAQVPRIKATLEKLNIPYIAKDGFEADDLIATLAKNATRLEIDTIMVTGDKDLLQLVNDHVFALRPVKEAEGYRLFGEKEVAESFGIKPSQIVDYLSLLGDSSDNVPGVRGIGEKGAVKLLTEYVTLDGIYRHLDSLPKGTKTKLEEGKEMAEFSKKLILLKSDVFTLDSFDTPEYQVSTVNYGAAVEDFEEALCKNLARSARALANGEVVRTEKSEKVNKKAEEEIDVPEEVLGLGSYETVTEREVLEQLLSVAEKNNLPVAFDTETTSLEPIDAKLVGFSLSFDLKKAYYIPLLASSGSVMKEEDAIAVLKKYFEGRINVVGQNIKYDIQILLNYGIKLSNIVFDTMVASWLLDSNAGLYNMDVLALKYLHYETVKFEDVVKKGETFDFLDTSTQTKYAAEDADITLRLYHIFKPMLEKQKLINLYDKMENPLISVLADMESNGILLDNDRLEEIGDIINTECVSLTKKIYEEAGEEFNIKSSMQLSTILFEKRGLPPGKKTQSGYSTDTATLEELLSSGDALVPLILRYRVISKLQSTYVESLSSLVASDGRLHTQFLQTGTATGRLSSRNPNLQNIPIRTDEGRLIRTAFIPKEGFSFLSADYSQVELVVLSHLSGDAALRQAFLQGVDVHAHTASLIFDKESGEVTPDERRMAKTINFGIMYGMSAFRLASSLNISRSDAKAFMTRYFERYKGIKAFVEKTVKSAEEKRYVETMFSHRRTVLGINSRNKIEKAAAERVAVNTVIQGSAAEIMKKAMIEISQTLQTRGLSSKILLQVHDEVILEVKNEEKDEVFALVKERMENAVKLSVPLRVSLEFGSTWGDMH